jgi:hypothetical protein
LAVLASPVPLEPQLDCIRMDKVVAAIKKVFISS